MNARVLILLMSLIPLTACAGTASKPDDAARAARFEAAAGPAVSHIQFNSVNGFYAWDPISDHQIVAYVTPKKAYLVDLPSCPGLEHTPGLVVTSRLDQVSVNFDTITSVRTGIPCPIRRIRPLDLDRVKDAHVRQGHIKMAPRATSAQSAGRPGA